MPVDPFAFNFRHMRALVAIVAHGSISAAAQSVSLSQPALTQGLSKLERQLGVKLFDRKSDGVRPTPAGALLAERAATGFQHLAQAARNLARSGRGFTKPDLLMTGTQLQALLGLVETGSFVGASERSGVTQPALHRSVRDLEQLCGLALAERLGRGLVVTPAGRKLARGIRLAISEITAGIAELSPDPGVGTRIAVGAMPLSRARLMPNAIATMLRDHAKVTIDVHEGSWRELVEPLRDGAIDLMVGALRDPAPAGLVQEALFNDRLIIVGRAGHPLLADRAPSLASLASCGWIIGHHNTPLRQHWERLFAGRDLPAAPIECGSVMVIRGVLLQTDLLTLLSRDQVAEELDMGVLAQVGLLPSHGERTIGITTRENWRPTTIQARFIELLHQLGAGLQQIE